MESESSPVLGKVRSSSPQKRLAVAIFWVLTTAVGSSTTSYLSPDLGLQSAFLDMLTNTKLNSELISGRAKIFFQRLIPKH